MPDVPPGVETHKKKERLVYVNIEIIYNFFTNLYFLFFELYSLFYRLFLILMQATIDA